MARGGPFNTLALKYTTSEMLGLVVWAHYATLVSAQSTAASVDSQVQLYSCTCVPLREVPLEVQVVAQLTYWDQKLGWWRCAELFKMVNLVTDCFYHPAIGIAISIYTGAGGRASVVATAAAAGARERAGGPSPSQRAGASREW